jgi:hypothetical protein
MFNDDDSCGSGQGPVVKGCKGGNETCMSHKIYSKSWPAGRLIASQEILIHKYKIRKAALYIR